MGGCWWGSGFRGTLSGLAMAYHRFSVGYIHGKHRWFTADRVTDGTGIEGYALDGNATALGHRILRWLHDVQHFCQ